MKGIKIILSILSVIIITSILMIGCGPAEQTTTPATTTPATTATTTPATTTPATTTPAGPDKYGGTYRIGDYRQTAHLGFPAMQTAGYGKRQAMPAIETLLRLDEAGKLVPWLATDWELDPEGPSITLTLRQGVKFHDMTDFNAAAVKWNIDICKEKGQFGTSLIESVNVIDDYHVRIDLVEWDNTLLDMLAYSYMGMMVSPTAYETNGEEWMYNHMVGTGPFVHTEWVKDVVVKFERFDNYWQEGKPYLDAIEDHIIIDRTVGRLAFENGETDDIIEPLAQDIIPLRDKGYTLQRLPFAAFCSVMLAAQVDGADPNSPFSDERVRIACQKAINTKEMNDTILYGLGWAATQWLPEGHWAYDPTIPGYPYDPDGARELLKEAGFENGFKTQWQYSTSPEGDQAAQAVQAYFKAVGIELELIPKTSPELRPIWTQGGSWDGMLFSGPPPYPDAAAGFRDRFMDGDKYYTEMYVPDDYREAVHKATTAATLEDKVKWTKEANRLFTMHAVAIYMYSSPKSMIEQPYLHDTGMFRVATDSQWTPEDAWIEKGVPKI